jgi:hypothetical protein
VIDLLSEDMSGFAHPSLSSLFPFLPSLLPSLFPSHLHTSSTKNKTKKKKEKQRKYTP